MKNIKKTVLNLVKKHGTRDPYIIAKRCGLEIHERILPDNINGFYLNIKSQRCIFINSRLEDWLKKIVVTHELGHHLFHKHVNQIFTIKKTNLNERKYETEADKFVVELLFPDEYLIECSTFIEFNYLPIPQKTASYFMDLRMK